MSDNPVVGVDLSRDFQDALERMHRLGERIGECIEAARDTGIDAAGIETALISHAAWMIAKIDDDETREFRIALLCDDLRNQIEFYRTGTMSGTMELSESIVRKIRRGAK